MNTRRLRGMALAAIAILGTSACGRDDGAERSDAAFCSALADLSDNDPFTDLATASPGEMRTAFDQLARGVAAIADSAPSDLSVAARQYEDAVGSLVDELAAAGYDPRRLDSLPYAQAAQDYADAAVSLEQDAQTRCR